MPEYTFYVLSILKARVRGENGILREGPHFVIPFISSFEQVSMELVKKDIKFTFTTKDGYKLAIEGVFQYRPDPDVVHLDPKHPDYGRNVFVTVSEEVILAGVIEAVEARIGGIGGNHPHTVFIESRPALGDIVNAVLRLARPPHIMHKQGSEIPDPNESNWGKSNWFFCGNPDCKFDKPINANELIDFYNFHWPEIRVIKANESALSDSRSDIEQRYGIDVETFDLGNVSFTPETEAALEEEKQAEARGKAAKSRITVAKQFLNDIGVSPQTAVDEADLLMDPTIKKSIVSVQGETGILGGFLSAIMKKEGKNA
ncbi:MAG: SPFH domain-containing protein [Candidatus Paceibacterota bacterium]